ncbi:TPA: hypothetical protein H6U13_004701, partial [Escherichia coli]|nr:hypothetical protein [Escherichia coli]
LLTIAEVNQNVPANPPKTLQEALQSTERSPHNFPKT